MSCPEEKKDFLWNDKIMERTKMNKIQISPKKMVEDAVVIWPEKTPDVDLVIDPRMYPGLNLKDNSVKVLYVFNLLGITMQKDIIKVLKNIYKALAPDGQLYIIEYDFEYISRAFTGGDLSIEEFNEDFIRTTYLTKDSTIKYLELAGFSKRDMRVWLDGAKFPKQHYEFIISGVKKLIQ